MVLVNFATKEMVAKIVYYGPALCGKTTNLQYIFTRLNPKKRGKLISLATEADRTLFFDFLPLEFGTVQGFKIRFQLYTVPGQVFYGATRKLVLKGADAVIFVADSQTDVMDRNVESIEDMKANLVENGLDPYAIPLIMQYNKRDLPGISPVEELEEKVNFRGVPSFEASAVEGFGVMEAFRETIGLLLQDLKRKHSFIDIESVKELPSEVFEQKQEEAPEEDLIDAEVEYELELGSSVAGSGAEEDVVAGELLGQIETISLADTCQAEAFFDDVRKGVPTEEARQKAARNAAGDPEACPASSSMDEQVFASAWEMQGAGGWAGQEEGVVDVSPVELSPVEPSPSGPSAQDGEYEIMHESMMMGDMPPTPSGTFRKPDVKPPSDGPFLGLDMTSPEMMEPDGVVFEGLDPAGQAHAELFADAVPELAPEPARPKPSQEAEPRPSPGPNPRSQQKPDAPVSGGGAAPSKPAPALAMATPRPAPPREPSPDAASTVARLDGVMSAIERLDGRLADLGREVAGLKGSLARHGHTSDAPHPEPVAGNVAARVEELGEAMKGMAEGQDRLLLSILEAVREAKRNNADNHEKIEDALKYLIDKVRGDDRTPGKKKWF